MIIVINYLFLSKEFIVVIEGEQLCESIHLIILKQYVALLIECASEHNPAD